MLHRRRHNINHFDSLDKGLNGVEATHVKLLLHRFRRDGIGIIETDQIVTVNLLDAFNMYLSQVPGTQDANFQHNMKFGQR